MQESPKKCPSCGQLLFEYLTKDTDQPRFACSDRKCGKCWIHGTNGNLQAMEIPLCPRCQVELSPVLPFRDEGQNYRCIHSCHKSYIGTGSKVEENVDNLSPWRE